MPIKSRAQRRKFAELLMKGEISEEVYERWNREAGRKELPERVTPKDKKKGRGTKKTTRARKTARKTARGRKTTRRTKTTARKTTRRRTSSRAGKSRSRR
ncbi:MAG TPA: hypothetical protein VJP45_06855 [Candidatus Limnocylindria bacterium]|nr:hypothetical protein [Candidatus Limnocylindria bacterium]